MTEILFAKNELSTQKASSKRSYSEISQSVEDLPDISPPLFDNCLSLDLKLSCVKICISILKMINEKAGTMPVILCGDFNSEPSNGAYKILAACKEPELIESSTLNPIKENCTFTGFAVNGGICKQIDFIFYSKQFSLIQNQTITQNNGQYYPSDHLPVKAILYLN